MILDILIINQRRPICSTYFRSFNDAFGVGFRLPHPRENVCMTVNEDGSLFAVGSQSHVTFVDPRVLKVCGTRSILCKQRGCGIRSLSFKNDLLTIGTGEIIMISSEFFCCFPHFPRAQNQGVFIIFLKIFVFFE